MELDKLLVKVRKDNRVIYTIDPKYIMTSMGVHVPMVVMKACLVHGAIVDYKGLRLTRVHQDNL